MALASRLGNMLKQASSKHVSIESSLSNLSLCQAVRFMSSSKLFVGGLPWSIDDGSLREEFAQHGEVTEARVIIDQMTGRSRGFGFVTYTSSEEASSAKQAMDGQELQGRRVKVDFATDRPRQGGFGGGSYGGGNRYGGGNNYGGGGNNYGGGYGNYGGGGRGGGNNYGGGYGSYADGGGNVGSYGGGNSGGYGGGNSGGYDVAGSGDGFSAAGGSSGEFSDTGFSGTGSGGTTGNDGLSLDGADGGEPEAIENTRN
ncbi:hypothetical protein DCAR_0729236 [Daucus carota subsp. sativus]|uniref:RRM domain-containing protein n=1 Tax=Daucus carota subsp. sativus TaxID=79200 RepID=A0A164U2G9_DAUCS|nr:PREDICTED: glycine-rich RNA-binding protein 3, mitochondrial [Daucus carota subsp. sativus]WOH09777.1 hypothetical protein DCAR_0729236 [Daucus carota subsp. sativus]